MGQYGADIMMFLRARDAKREAKMALKEAKDTYDQAKAGLEDLRANFNAAFESSAENEK